MRITKVLISFTIIITMLFSVVHCSVSAEEDYNAEILTLSGLGIVSGYSSDNYINRQTVTWKEYLTAVLKLMLDDIPDGNVLGMAKQYDLISEADNISLATAISFDDAVRISVKVLGYDALNKILGKSYYKIASENKILKGVNKTEKLNSNQFLRILYNMTEVNLLEYSYSGNNSGFTVGSETLLSKYRKILKSSGVMYFNEYTSIYGSDGGKKNRVGINGGEYHIYNKDYNKYLGMNVDYYYDDEIVVCIVPRKNTELVVTADDYVGISPSFDRFDYTENTDSERSRKVDLNQIKVIYNGKCVTGYAATIFDIKEGNFRLVDNDSDGKYDVIFITSYNIVKVNSIDYQRQVIVNEYDNLLTTVFGGKKLDFGEFVQGEDLIVLKDGNTVDFSSINNNDILLLEYSISGSSMLVSLNICNDSVSGTVSGINTDENEIIVNSVKYKLNKEFADMVSAFNLYAQMPEISKTYTFYLDASGKIAGCSLIASEGEVYALLYNVKYDRVNDAVKIYYVDTNNEHKITALSDKTTIDGVKYTGSDEKKTKLAGFHGQIIQLSYDTQGTVRRISSAIPKTGTTNPNEFSFEPKQSLEYRASSKGSATFGGKYYVDENTKSFVIFDITSNSKEDYECVPFSQQYFNGTGEKNYISITPYNVDRFGFIGIVLADAKQEDRTLHMVVSKSYVGLNEDEEQVHILSGCVGNFVDINVETKNPVLFSGVSRGDYIEVTVDSDGMAKAVTVIYSKSMGTKYQNITGNFYSSAGTYMGTLKDIDVGGKRMKIDLGTDGEKSFNMSRLLPPVYICEDNTVRISDISEIDIGDMMIVSVSRDLPQRIVVYK